MPPTAVSSRASLSGWTSSMRSRPSSTRVTPTRSGCATAGPRRSVLAAQEPFGVSADRSWHAEAFPLEAGDRVLFLTDGMLERNAQSLDIPQLMLASAHLHPREAIQ